MLLGYICALLVGISLGALGMGGSILTIPIMVYIMHVSPMDATGYSLFVVGLTSTVGSARYIRQRLVDLRTASVFAIPSVVTVFLTRAFLVPAIPAELRFGAFFLTKNDFVLLCFAVLMTLVGFRMLGEGKYEERPDRPSRASDFAWLIFLGSVSGLLTGLLGVGGGFIIVPSLVLLARVPIRMSVGTSLLVIALNSWIGFIGEMLVRHETIDYKFLILFGLFSVAGIFAGFLLAGRMATYSLKKLFGWIVLLTGVSIFIREFLFR